MPIQIRTTKSLGSVNAKLRVLETKYDLTSAQFESDADASAKVPEFDAIEWNFLLMQKSAMEEDDGCEAAVFPSSYRSVTESVNTNDFYDQVAA
jgi:hypothetical protein